MQVQNSVAATTRAPGGIALVFPDLPAPAKPELSLWG